MSEEPQRMQNLSNHEMLCHLPVFLGNRWFPHQDLQNINRKCCDSFDIQFSNSSLIMFENSIAEYFGESIYFI